MSVEEAARALQDRLRDAPWVTAVGVGERGHSPCIYLYVKALKRDETEFLKDGWHGYPVEVKKMATPRLASGSR
jgi:hypothetical protein